MENLRFLVFLAAVIKAVDEYQDLLRVAVASPGQRPTVWVQTKLLPRSSRCSSAMNSVRSSTHWLAMLNIMIMNVRRMDLGVAVLPKFSKDNTDRNRTSPFAFTGNKFEFRAPGSNMNLSDVNTVLNTAVAKELREFADVLESAENFEAEAMALVKKTVKEHKRIIFNGNGYSEEWPIEAEKRGLLNLRSTVDALPTMLAEKNLRLMNDFGVMSPAEMNARYEVGLENYSKVLNIEALTMLEMANSRLFRQSLTMRTSWLPPSPSRNRVNGKISCNAEEHQLETLAECADTISEAINDLRIARKSAKNDPDPLASARAFHDVVIPIMDKLRAAADHAEQVCGEDYWPLPTYTQMLWYVKD